MNKRWKEILEKYGRLAIIIYLVTFVFTFGGTFLMIQFGFKDSVVQFFQEYLGDEYSAAGTVVLAYAITKITQPIRIALTIVVLPIFGKSKVNS